GAGQHLSCRHVHLIGQTGDLLELSLGEPLKELNILEQPRFVGCSPQPHARYLPLCSALRVGETLDSRFAPPSLQPEGERVRVTRPARRALCAATPAGTGPAATAPPEPRRAR